MSSGAPTVGVEEEYFVVDATTGQLFPGADVVIEAAGAQLGSAVSREISQFYVECRTEPTDDLHDVARQLTRTRSLVANAAESIGLRIVATGTPALGEVAPVPLSPGRRYAEQAAAFRGLVDEQAICACHVHIHLPDREQAVAVANHLRLWLPVLVALGANSPFWAGRDTGYASWRAVSWGRWPVAGPPPYCSSLAEYDELVAILLETETITDAGTVFWDMRLSSKYPTLEVRVADVQMTPAETVMLVAVMRALVMTAVADVERGIRAARPSGALLRAAYWRAARDGPQGRALHPVTGALTSAAQSIDRLRSHIAAALVLSGDDERVTRGLRHLVEHGGGAARQRRLLARRGLMQDVVDGAAQATAGRAFGIGRLMPDAAS